MQEFVKKNTWRIFFSIYAERGGEKNFVWGKQKILKNSLCMNWWKNSQNFRKGNKFPSNHKLVRFFNFVNRNKRADEQMRRDIAKSGRHGLGILPSRKPRLAESALSSGESTTGDSSQQSQNSQRSQRSVVYLHAATSEFDKQ